MRWLFENELKINPFNFDDDTKAALFATYIHALTNVEEFKPIKGYDFPRFPDGEIDYFGIKTIGYIEMVAAEIDEWFANAEIICGCVYRKDHSKPLTKYEIYENAVFFKSQGMGYTIHAINFFEKLSENLKEVFPLLYEGKNTGKTDDHPYSIINALSGEDVTKWEDCKQLTIDETFIYLQEAKVKHLNEKNKG